MNHYETLGVAETASQQEIKAAYRRVARESHPDRLFGSSPQAVAKAQEVFAAASFAYSVLGDPERRDNYDRGRSASADIDRMIESAATESVLQLFSRLFANTSAFSLSHMDLCSELRLMVQQTEQELNKGKDMARAELAKLAAARRRIKTGEIFLAYIEQTRRRYVLSLVNHRRNRRIVARMKALADEMRMTGGEGN